MKASHKEYDLVVGYTQVHLMPGEFVFGLRKASKELKISVQSIRTILEFLKTSQNLTHRSTHLFSIISIVNWDTYQSQENEVNTPINKQVTHGQHTGNNKQEHKNKRINNNIFNIPTIEEIRVYCNERKNKIDPEYFFEYQNARGWKFKTGLPMKSWKATIITWEKNNFTKGSDNGTGTFKKPYRTERDAINQSAGDAADIIRLEYEKKLAASACHTKEEPR